LKEIVMEITPPQGNCCVLGRAMNLHNLPQYDPAQIEERPAIQLGLLALSAVSFLVFFIL
jgi:hypothetical protein